MRAGKRSLGGFTLVELLVATAVFLLLMTLVIQLFNSAVATVGLRNKQMDSDAQAEAVFDRMAVDFGQLVQRPDVDYFLKSSAADQYGNKQPQVGNDQMAFYSQVPGYYTTSVTATSRMPVSLVGWRVNAGAASSNPALNQLQRFGCGLVWNNASAPGSTAVVFSTAPSGPVATATTANTIFQYWPHATNNTDPDANYETAGPQVFRLEYSYVLRGQTAPDGTVFNSQLSDIPWEMRPDTSGQPYHNSISGLQDVAAIMVIVAIIDPRSRVLVSDSQLATLAASMNDFPATDAGSGINITKRGDLENQWQAALNNGPASGIPRDAASSMRIYQRTFQLPYPSSLTP